MFTLFRKRTKLEKLQLLREKLLQEAKELYRYNRRDSKRIELEAEKIQKKIEESYNLTA